METGEELRNKLNRETAKITWPELERFYAQGAVIELAAGQDLVDVAAAIATDDSAKISTLMQTGLLGKVDDLRAQALQTADAPVWAVVVAPWVLIQATAELAAEER